MNPTGGAVVSGPFHEDYEDMNPDFVGRSVDEELAFLDACQNSYCTHFGPRAVEAAEGDYLGRLLAIVRDLSQSTDIRTLPLGLHVRIDNILATTTKGNA